MIAAGADLKIYIATRPIDFRCGHDGLAAKVQEMLRLDPFSGDVRKKPPAWTEVSDGIGQQKGRPFGRLNEAIGEPAGGS
ncbi:IS66 family insertion sequence element accessory protein TnpB [Bradyrhizobium sp. 188]|uniref:IS66 family insertion sequence element accessory protein TnpB n=1 Tax=Bradyrhizobium sp. 188 TaxID=2782656 RepID=UPI001FF7752A|nr:IS66 family insertion sequence element accessory protein TnpB [Bradyrhizobium sp. 188]MCK1499352.1 IS66 family insertion sequence element accessory protein TnpB [Bradyrhizobium sp. 188]